MQISELDEVRDAESDLREARSRASNLRRKLNNLPARIGEKRDELADARAEAEVEGADPSESDDVQALRQEVKELKATEESLREDLATAEKVVEKLESRREEAVQAGMKRVKGEVRPEVAEAIEQALAAWSDLQGALDVVREADRTYTRLDRSAMDSSRFRPQVLVSELYDLSDDLPAEDHEAVQSLKAARDQMQAEA